MKRPVSLATATPRDATVADSIADAIARGVAERIVNGMLEPGARLRQDQIAAEFDVSHVPVREAFRKLEARGLVVNRPRRGVVVAPMDPAVILEATEMRAELEGLALRFAFPHLTASHLKAARNALADGESKSEITAWDSANRRFHRAITEPCGMPRLMALIDDLHDSTARFLFATWKKLDWQPRSDTEHRAILHALTRRDGERAEQLLKSHVREAGHALIASLTARASHKTHASRK